MTQLTLTISAIEMTTITYTRIYTLQQIEIALETGLRPPAL